MTSAHRVDATSAEPRPTHETTRTGPSIGPPVGAIREVEVEGCLTIYRRDLDRVLVLNATASDVWRLCDGTLDEPSIIRLLARAYEVDANLIVDDVRSAVQRFVGEGFVDLRVP
jgi:hypothetical protein